ncbi:MAG: hypothetical protein ACTS6J_20790 [Burkholderiales bacterium]
METSVGAGGPSAAAVRRLLRPDCRAVSDALDKLQLSGLVSGLPQLAGCGPAMRPQGSDISA